MFEASHSRAEKLTHTIGAPASNRILIPVFDWQIFVIQVASCIPARFHHFAFTVNYMTNTRSPKVLVILKKKKSKYWFN